MKLGNLAVAILLVFLTVYQIANGAWIWVSVNVALIVLNALLWRYSPR